MRVSAFWKLVLHLYALVNPFAIPCSRWHPFFQTSKLRYREANSLPRFTQLRRAEPQLELSPAWPSKPLLRELLTWGELVVLNAGGRGPGG